jgi:hypothetical protein
LHHLEVFVLADHRGHRGAADLKLAVAVDVVIVEAVVET